MLSKALDTGRLVYLTIGADGRPMESPKAILSAINEGFLPMLKEFEEGAGSHYIGCSFISIPHEEDGVTYISLSFGASGQIDIVFEEGEDPVWDTSSNENNSGSSGEAQGQ